MVNAFLTVTGKGVLKCINHTVGLILNQETFCFRRRGFRGGGEYSVRHKKNHLYIIQLRKSN